MGIKLKVFTTGSDTVNTSKLRQSVKQKYRI